MIIGEPPSPRTILFYVLIIPGILILTGIIKYVENGLTPVSYSFMGIGVFLYLMHLICWLDLDGRYKK